jgi:hypothetical protein
MTASTGNKFVANGLIKDLLSRHGNDFAVIFSTSGVRNTASWYARVATAAASSYAFT